jgi:hypothetical protein
MPWARLEEKMRLIAMAVHNPGMVLIMISSQVSEMVSIFRCGSPRECNWRQLIIAINDSSMIYLVNPAGTGK